MNIPIYPGSSSFTTGSTPFGFYDTDPAFQADADSFALFAARRLGYPIVDIELQDVNFYAAFEEAVTTYGNELYAFQVAENLLTFQGSNTSIGSLNNQLIQPNMGQVVNLSMQYGEEAGVGGSVTWYSASLDLIEGHQSYDLGVWASSSLGISGSDLEIKRIHFEAPPALARYFDPYSGIGAGSTTTIDGFGGGNTPHISFLMMPVNYDIQRLQTVEFNDTIRRSSYSFELINNQLKIFPIPTSGMEKLWIRYILKSERSNPIDPRTAPSGSNLITNISNVPYNNPTYLLINSIGRAWIFEYALALVKEILGYVRGKYTQIPIPGAEVTLNQQDLISAATGEKAVLLEKFRGYLADTSRKALMQSKAEEAESHNKTLSQIPTCIYIG